MGEKKSLAGGTLFLTAINGLDRAIGFVYKIIIIRLVGPEPVGLLQMAYTVYFTLLVVTTAGIPLAISKLTAEYCAKGQDVLARKLFRYGQSVLFWTTSVTTLIGLGLVLFLPGAWLNGDSRQGLLLLLPALFFSARGSLIRGYFQGYRRLGIVGWSLVIEEAVHAGAAVAAALALLAVGGTITLGLAWAGLMSEIAGTLYLSFVYRRVPPPEGPDQVLSREEKKRLFRLALPVAEGKLATSLTMAVNTLLIPLRLGVAGFTVAESGKLLGEVNGAASTLLGIPSLFTFALAANLVPAISEASASVDNKNRQRLMNQAGNALRLTFAIGWPAALFFAGESSFLCRTIFNLPDAAVYLAIMAPAGIFLYLQQTCTGILQGVGRPDIPMRNFLLGALLETAGIWWLGADPRWGMKGIALATALGVTLTGALDLVSLTRHVPVRLDFWGWSRLVGAGLVCAETMRLLMGAFLGWGMDDVVSLGAAGFLCGPVYLLWLWRELKMGGGYVPKETRIH
jgi:stage V sporulation protein B